MKTCGIISHRGLCRKSPESARMGENTVEAFEDGVSILASMGFKKAIEFDIRLSKDGVPIVIHDETLDRTTNGRGFVGDYTVAELKKLDAGFGRKIPLLSEMLDRFAREEMEFHIELKESGLAEMTKKFILDRKMEKRVIVSAFNNTGKKGKSATTWEELALLKPEVKFALIAGGDWLGGKYYEKWIAEAVNRGAFALDVSADILDIGGRDFIEKCHGKNLQINSWTVNDAREYAKLGEFGVDNVFCDNPLFLRMAG